MAPTIRTLAGIDYNTYYVKELQDFIDERKGTRTNMTRRHRLIRILKFLDRDWTFPRFLELPPELRVVIYKFLLWMDPATSSVGNLGILLANKQIYQEAHLLLYHINAVKIRISHFHGSWFGNVPLPRGEYLKGRGAVANMCTRLPGATCQKIEHLVIEFSTNGPSGRINRMLLALANVFGRSASLRTVQARMFDSRQILYTADPLHVLYPLTKLRNSDIQGKPPRAVSFTDFPRRIEQDLRRRLSSGTPRPVDAIGALTDLRERVLKMEESMMECSPVDENFDILLSALPTVLAETDMQDLSGVGYADDSAFCRKVRSLQKFFESHERQWQGRIRDNVLHGMSSAQEEVDRRSAEVMSRWLCVQETRFGRSMRKQSDSWRHMRGSFSL